MQEKGLTDSDLAYGILTKLKTTNHGRPYEKDYVKSPNGFMSEKLLRQRVDIPESELSERAKRLYREALLELGDALPLPE